MTQRVRLPRTPPADNHGRTCELVDGGDLPSHLTRCRCESHDGVCDVCSYKVTVGMSGREFGHARESNRVVDGEHVACPHRPPECDPTSFQRGKS